jgi:cytidine deaminase
MATLEGHNQQLYETAIETLERHYDPARHTTGVAVRTGDGSVYTGISLKAATGSADVHAEPVAVGRAILNGASSFDTTVAVQFDEQAPSDGADPTDSERGTRIVSPCGACRELLATQAPRISVVVPGPEGPIVEPLSEILPY